MSTRPQHLYEFGPYRLDTAEQLLLRDGEPVPLTPKSFETLLVLVERSGHLVEKDELMKSGLGGRFVEESNLTNNVYALRKLLGPGENGRTILKRCLSVVIGSRPLLTSYQPKHWWLKSEL